jgi:hypothetical protein
MAGPRILVPLIGVRIPAPQPARNDVQHGENEKAPDIRRGRFFRNVVLWWSKCFLGSVQRPQFGSVLRSKEHGVQLLRSLPLHPRDDVAIGVQRLADVRVAQAVTYHLGMYPGEQQQGRAAQVWRKS